MSETQHADYPHHPGTLWDCPACTPMLVIMEKADAQGITLDASDFRVIDGELTIDSMPAAEWLDAMTDGGE